jgi:hypothetical protein
MDPRGLMQELKRLGFKFQYEELVGYDVCELNALLCAYKAAGGSMAVHLETCIPRNKRFLEKYWDIRLGRMLFDIRNSVENRLMTRYANLYRLYKSHGFVVRA